MKKVFLAFFMLGFLIMSASEAKAVVAENDYVVTKQNIEEKFLKETPEETFLFEFPLSAGECTFSLNTEDIKFLPISDFIPKMKSLVEIKKDVEGKLLIVKINVPQNYVSRIEVSFKYLFQKNEEGVFYTFDTTNTIPLSEITSFKDKVLALPTECLPRLTTYLTTIKKESK